MCYVLGVENNDQNVSIRMPRPLVRELKAIADGNGRTLSAEARLALRAWLLKTMMEKP